MLKKFLNEVRSNDCLQYYLTVFYLNSQNLNVWNRKIIKVAKIIA